MHARVGCPLLHEDACVEQHQQQEKEEEEEEEEEEQQQQDELGCLPSY